MNNFDQAFRILVDELADFEYAENYCLTLSQGKSSGDRRIVAHVLFKILLNSLDKYETFSLVKENLLVSFFPDIRLKSPKLFFVFSVIPKSNSISSKSFNVCQHIGRLLHSLKFSFVLYELTHINDVQIAFNRHLFASKINV